MREYIHGFDAKEQRRLVSQAKFLSPHLAPHFDFSNCRKILEVGCGVGAQTKILLRSYPKARIHGLDPSPTQIDKAKSYLRAEIIAGRASLTLGTAKELRRATKDSFDAAYICWIFEHLSDPVSVLKDVAVLIKPHSQVVAIEVFNESLFLHGPCPATMEYWHLLCDAQKRAGGDPNVGPKVAGYMRRAGFSVTNSYPINFMFDGRQQRIRNGFLDYWTSLLESAVPNLGVKVGVAAKLFSKAKGELAALKKSRDGIFFYSPVITIGSLGARRS